MMGCECPQFFTDYGFTKKTWIFEMFSDTTKTIFIIVIIISIITPFGSIYFKLFTNVDHYSK